MQIWAPQPPPHATSQHCKHGKHGTAGVPPEDDTIRATGVRLHAEMHVESRMGFLVIKLDGRLDQSSRGGGGEWRLTPCRPLPPHPRPHLNTSLHSPLARGREGGREGRREGSAKPACGSRARQPCVRPCVRSLRAVLGGRSTATRHPVCWLSPAALAPRS